jgi:hypothetical protein
MATGNGSAVVLRSRIINLPDGTPIELAQFTFRDFQLIKEEACAHYKRSMIATYTRNLDLIPEDRRAKILDDALSRAEAIGPENLPKKTHKMPVRNQETGKLVRDPASGQLVIENQEIEYYQWWLSFTIEGQVFSVWLGARKCKADITLDYIQRVYMNHLQELDSAADAMGELSEPRLGNEEAPAAAAGPVPTSTTGP